MHFNISVREFMNEPFKLEGSTCGYQVRFGTFSFLVVFSFFLPRCSGGNEGMIQILMVIMGRSPIPCVSTAHLFSFDLAANSERNPRGATHLPSTGLEKARHFWERK